MTKSKPDPKPDDSQKSADPNAAHHPAPRRQNLNIPMRPGSKGQNAPRGRPVNIRPRGRG
jgi:hypothetical protein